MTPGDECVDISSGSSVTGDAVTGADVKYPSDVSEGFEVRSVSECILAGLRAAYFKGPFISDIDLAIGPRAVLLLVLDRLDSVGDERRLPG